MPGCEQPSGGPRLALEAPADDPLARQDLDRDVALEPFVASQPDRPEAAGAQPPVKPVALQDQPGLAGASGGVHAAPSEPRAGPRPRAGARWAADSGPFTAFSTSPGRSLRDRGGAGAGARPFAVKTCLSSRPDGHTEAFTTLKEREACRSSTRRMSLVQRYADTPA